VNPYLLTALSSAAAIVAVAVASRNSPTRRQRQLRAAQRRIAYLTATGALRVDSRFWERYWDEHGLDDCMRGGSDA
jgi:hypothetical protein